MLLKYRIQLVALMISGFVFAASWIVPSPAAQSVSQAIGNMSYSEWSKPELVKELSTDQNEAPGSMSRDGLSLYFYRFNPGMMEDLYVSHRLNRESKWEPPIRLSDIVNSSASEKMPIISGDGHWLYYSSNCQTGVGSSDVYASWRENVSDDFAWQPPVNLAAVSSTMYDWAPQPFVDEGADITMLYLTMDRTLFGHQSDIYMSILGPNGWDSPKPITELNCPVPFYFDGFPSPRRDGREIFFTSNRPGGLGEMDVWVSKRNSTQEPWSPPENVTVLNNEKQNQSTALSWDGTTMYLAIGDHNATDIYETHRDLVNSANICFRSPQYYWHKLQFKGARIGTTSVIIGGINNNQPINTAFNLDLVKRVLQGNTFPGLPPATISAWFNQEFLAAQLSVGGISSPTATNALKSQLQRYNSMANFQPLLLSNGVMLTHHSTLGEVFEQARLALIENRCQDQCELVVIFDALNGNDPSGSCHQ